MFLAEIIEIKKKEVFARKALSPGEETKAIPADLPPPRDFLKALSENGPVALIAEIKRASPSAGPIRQDADIGHIVRQYEAGGACALSVLTEEKFFGGSLADLARVRAAVSLPILQKDFIIDPWQIYEGRAAGADAVLLIAAALQPAQLKEFAERARCLGMVPLVEIHSEEDLEKISGLNLPLLGINNRDLQTLQVDLQTTLRLIGKLPEGPVVVSESGIKDRRDVARLQAAGVKGILVGEILMRASDPAAKIRELLAL